MHGTSFKPVLTAVLIAVLGVLAGCDQLGLTPEAKINAAIPLSSEVVLAKSDLLANASSDQKKSLEEEFAGRLKLRALTCAKGYSPSWYTSKDQILQKFPNRSCFSDADNDIAKWLGLRRVGLMLAMPPLRPVPATPAKYFVGDGTIQSAVFAERAGVALFMTYKGLQVIDMESGKPLFEEAKAGGSFGSLSPNGRLFSAGADGRIKIRSAESGAVLVELPKVRSQEIQWLDNRSALYVASDNKFVLLDFALGKESPVPEIENSQGRVVPVHGSTSQFLIGSYRTLSKIELVKKDQDVAIKLVEEKPAAGGWSQGGGGLSSDGQYWFGANRNLLLASTKTLEQETVLFEPFSLQSAMPTPDPDKIWVSGYAYVRGGNGARSYLYSIANHTLTTIDRSKLLSERVIYIPSLKKMAVITESKVALLDDIPLGEVIPLDKMVAAATEEANQRKLEEFDRMQQMQQQSQGQQPQLQAQQRAVGAVVAPSAYPPVAIASSNAYRPSGGTAQLAALAKDAQIEAVGVYQSANASKRSGEPKAGPVEVRIRRTAKPVLLVLSSYESVRWNLVLEPGARLTGVLMAGYSQSQVNGAGATRVVTMGRSFAYQNNTPQYNALDNEVTQMTGRRIDVFQGRYEGSSFSIGGG